MHWYYSAIFCFFVVVCCVIAVALFRIVLIGVVRARRFLRWPLIPESANWNWHVISVCISFICFERYFFRVRLFVCLFIHTHILWWIKCWENSTMRECHIEKMGKCQRICMAVFVANKRKMIHVTWTFLLVHKSWYVIWICAHDNWSIGKMSHCHVCIVNTCMTDCRLHLNLRYACFDTIRYI